MYAGNNYLFCIFCDCTKIPYINSEMVRINGPIQNTKELRSSLNLWKTNLTQNGGKSSGGEPVGRQFVY